ncbi:MAG: sugar ABC transporter permease [Paenibacillaceae bacterium]|uniref:carbohydrate ABC transporter permease n=1 Tax=Paenibacillus cymbidii TaxID=1639034 RepID=UPI00143678CB|nr:sugar ABC transporter permease [Paenibacillus cymbidii]MBO9609623.1 sugar ABC transporter permease [Paenibacillaceae bacterium]
MSRGRWREHAAGYLFILPNLVGFGIFTVYGVLFSLTISFTDWDMLSGWSDIRFIGWANYRDSLHDPWFRESLLNNLFFVLFIPVQMLLALVCASILNIKFFGRNLVRSVVYLPYITSFVAISLIWFQLLHPTQGVVNQFLFGLGFEHPPKWFGSSVWVKPAVLLMLTWQGLGYKILLYSAGLQGISKDLYEAAEVDGASAAQRFFRITLPMISPVSFFILIISMIDTFMMWSQIQILTEGGPGTASTVIGYYIFKAAFVHSQMGYASAMAWVLFVIILVITLLQWRGQKKWVNYM